MVQFLQNIRNQQRKF